MKMYRIPALYVILILCALSGLTSCHKDFSDENAEVAFSDELVEFDTVFTTVGSATRNFRIYNTHKFDIKVDIDLAGGAHSQFSINVDGESGYSFNDVVIPARDSIFVHVKVNVNPNDHNTPFLITDSVICRHGTSVQHVDLLAYGQNANFIVADEGTSIRYKIIARAHETTRWTNEKPYVIYGGYAAVDSLGTLVIDPGTKIYFHNGAGLWIYRYGKIEAVGTADDPIVFRGDQLNSWFSTDYAQWDRIWINESPFVNRLEYVEITHAFIGLQVETLKESLQRGSTVVKNSIIHNTYNSGVVGRNCRVVMENCQVSNNGACGLQLQIGTYDLKHLTVANYFSQAQPIRKTAALCVSNTYNNYIGNTDFTMVNSIVYGLMEDEISLSETAEQNCSQSVAFEKCIVKCTSALPNFRDCLRNQDPLFTSAAEQDYHLRSGSPAIDAGKHGLNITLDIEDNPRDALPDIGAYEFR